MFQYACARCIADRNSVPLVLDLRSFKYDKAYKRKFLLDNLNIRYDEVITHSSIKSDILYKNFNRFIRLLGLRKVILEPDFYSNQKGYNEELRQGFPVHKFDSKLETLNVNKRIELIGYWQSYKYFENSRELLLEDLEINKPLPLIKSNELYQTKETNAVCIGIRRFKEAKEAEMHYSVPADYYHKAIKFLLEKINNPHFYIFTLDKEWALKNIVTNHQTTFIKPSENSCIDLELMKKCKHFIISNSTFHWWGAWLSRNSTKIVITPKLGWTNDHPVPEAWIQI